MMDAEFLPQGKTGTIGMRPFRAKDFVEVNHSEDPQYHVATDRSSVSALAKLELPTG